VVRERSAKPLYVSSILTRASILPFRFCRDAGWLDRVPKPSTINVDEPPTMPLLEKQYATLLETIPKVLPGRRPPGFGSGPIDLERREIQRDERKKLTRVTTARRNNA
jgi:hypothetical protein